MAAITESKRRRDEDDDNSPPANGANEDIADLRQWMSQFGGKDIRVQISRITPTSYKGQGTAGILDTLDELVDEEMIRTRFGGGKYKIRLWIRDKMGRMPFGGSTVFQIAGNPKLPDDGEEGGPSFGRGTGGEHLAVKVLEQQERIVREERAAAAQAKQQSGFDPQLLSALQAPVIEQMRDMREGQAKLHELLASKDAMIVQTLSSRREEPDGGFKDRILEKMVDGESARVDTLRANHESEMRQLRERHQSEIDRERDRLKEDARSREKQHEREIEALNKSNNVAESAMKLAYETRIDGLKSEVARLQGDIVILKTEMAEIRSRKEKTMPEQIDDMVKMREALKVISGGDGEEDDKQPWYARMASNIIENPEAIGQILGGARGALGSTPEQQQVEQQQAELHAQQQAQAQQIQMRRLKKKRAQARRAQEATAGAEPGAPGAPAPAAPGRAPNAKEIQQAITFMEGAAANGTSPAAFAATARMAVGTDILKYIEAVGVDAMLDAASLPDASIMRTQRGRNFAREVARILLQGE